MSSNYHTRELALGHAVAIATGSSEYLHNADKVVEAANLFDLFLSGGSLKSAGQCQTGSAEPVVEPVEVASAPDDYAANVLSCENCAGLDKDLKTAGFYSLVTPLSEIQELSAGAIAALGKAGIEYFGQIVDLGPQVLSIFEEEEHAEEVLAILNPVGMFLMERHQNAKDDSSEYSEYGSLPLDSFSDLNTNTVTILHNAGFQTIGDIAHSLSASMRVLQLLPEPSQSMAVLGHVVTNLKHDVNDSPKISEEKRASLIKSTEKLQALVALGKDITTTGERPVLTKDSEKLLKLMQSSIDMGGGRFAVNAADPEVAALLKDLVGDGIQVGGAHITLAKVDGDEVDPTLVALLKGLGLNPGKQTRH